MEILSFHPKKLGRKLSYRGKEVLVSSLALAIVALAWGTSYAIIKDSLTTIRPFTLMSLRFGLSTLLLSLIYSKRLRNVSTQDLYRGSIIGAFMFLSFLTMVTGIGFTTASKQSFIVGSFVLIVPLLAWAINKRRPDAWAIAGAMLATAGVGLLTIDSRLIFNTGDILSVLCAVFFACHMIAIEKFGSASDPVLLTIVQFFVTSILFIALTGIFESYDFSSAGNAVGTLFYLIVVTTVIAFVVQNVAQRYISSTSTAMILTLESVFGSIFAVYLLNEVMTVQMVIGCIVVFLGILTQETRWAFLRLAK